MNCIQALISMQIWTKISYTALFQGLQSAWSNKNQKFMRLCHLSMLCLAVYKYIWHICICEPFSNTAVFIDITRQDKKHTWAV